jgi:hypothetical protein
VFAIGAGKKLANGFLRHGGRFVAKKAGETKNSSEKNSAPENKMLFHIIRRSFRL